MDGVRLLTSPLLTFHHPSSQPALSPPLSSPRSLPLPSRPYRAASVSSSGDALLVGMTDGITFKCFAQPHGRRAPSLRFPLPASPHPFLPPSPHCAASVSSSGDALLVGMTDGISFKCAHNLMDGVRLPEYPAQPAAVLKLEDGSRILLPILIPHLSSQMLIDSVRGVPLGRPTVYMLMRDMIELMGYEISLIRITHRDGDAYCARAYLSKVSADSSTATTNSSTGPAMMSLDMRPSDAINLAARAKVPIQVRKSLAVADGVRIVGMVRSAVAPGHGGRLLRRQQRVVLTSEDMPDLEDLSLADEFALVRLMEEAAQHERYGDAAKIKDQLMKLRRRTNKV
ncbi:unnamed protein product [Closterium sp. Naga37s-1]|nr:unnamed protein product [Closterium sp. Naga37s-1]